MSLLREVMHPMRTSFISEAQASVFFNNYFSLHCIPEDRLNPPNSRDPASLTVLG
jgi:hypothetical protein